MQSLTLLGKYRLVHKDINGKVLSDVRKNGGE